MSVESTIMTDTVARVEEMVAQGKKHLTAQILDDSTQYVPVYDGTLRDSGKVDGDKVVWDANFAKRVYNMPDSSKWTLDRGAIEPHSHWFEVAKSRHLGQWLDDTAEAMSKK